MTKRKAESEIEDGIAIGRKINKGFSGKATGRDGLGSEL